MRRVIPLLTVGIVLLAAAEPLFAQQRLFAVLSGDVVELDPRLPSLGTVLRRFSGGAETTGGIAPLGGGAYLAWVSPGQSLSLLDTRSGALQQFTVPDFSPRNLIGTDGNARLLVFGKSAAGRGIVVVGDTNSGSVRLLDIGPAWTVGQLAYAAASDVLFVARPRGMVFGSGVDFEDVDVIDTRTGNVLKTLDIAPVTADRLLTNTAGTRLFVNRFAPGGAFAFDVASGTPLGSIPLPQTSTNVLSLDQARGRLLISSDGLEAFSMDSLVSLGTISLPAFPLPPPPYAHAVGLRADTDVSGQSATIFELQVVVFVDNLSLTTCGASRLVALDAATGQLRGTADLSAFSADASCGPPVLVRVTEPGSPQGATVTVSGHQVTLDWQTTMDATGYDIEAGSAPGLTNLATVSVTDTHLTIEGVPPGVYYLRVRAINTIGKSAVSQEIRVVVQ